HGTAGLQTRGQSTRSVSSAWQLRPSACRIPTLEKPTAFRAVRQERRSIMPPNFRREAMRDIRSCTAHYLTTVLLTSVSWCECCAQPPLSTGECSQFAPLRPFTDEELSQREARVLYGLGVRYQHQDRLLEALGAFEEAREQDPQ